MGLDMYLNRKTSVKVWGHQGPEERWTIIAKKGGEETPVKGERISYITEEVIYWRKANAIHAWFVRACQDGKDECDETYVERAQLEVLRDTCKAVLDDKSKAESLLPSQSGFFFGGTEYDKYYFEDLQRTYDSLVAILEEPQVGDFYYRSSW